MARAAAAHNPLGRCGAIEDNTKRRACVGKARRHNRTHATPPPPTCSDCRPGEVCVDQRTCETCTRYTLSGGPSPTTRIGVDDDLEVYLNSNRIFADTNGVGSQLDPITFGAIPGDALRIIATDADGSCRALDPLYLHCAFGTGRPRS